MYHKKKLFYATTEAFVTYPIVKTCIKSCQLSCDLWTGLYVLVTLYPRAVETIYSDSRFVAFNGTNSDK